MHISIVIVSIILVVSVFVPFFLFNAVGKGEIKKIKVQYKAAIAKNNLNMAQQETWGNSYIGIDPAQKKLLFLKVSQSGNYEQILDLHNITGSRILEKRKIVKSKDHKDAVLERIDLEVTLKNGERIPLNFYDNELEYKEDFEHLRAEKWQTIVKGHLSDAVVGKKVA